MLPWHLKSFSNHQNNPLHNPAFLEGIDEDLTTLVKRYTLGWSKLHIDDLVTLADQLSKPLKGRLKSSGFCHSLRPGVSRYPGRVKKKKKPLKEKGGFMKIMNFQLHQLSTQCQLKVNWPLFNSQPVEKASLEEKLILILEG